MLAATTVEAVQPRDWLLLLCIATAAVWSQAGCFAVPQGESNRVVGEHQLNRQSSRSHSIFMLNVTTTPEGGEGRSLVSSLLHSMRHAVRCACCFLLV
jgi:hypothetical protein